MYDIMHLPQVIEIGKTGENQFRKIEIDMRPWLQVMPEGVASIVHILPGQTADDAYVAATTFEDGILTWIPGAGDLGTVEGYGQLEVWLEDTDSKRGKSAKVQTFVQLSLSPASEEPPAAQQAWLEQMTELKTQTVQAAGEAAQAAAQAAVEEAAVGVQAVVDSEVESALLSAGIMKYVGISTISSMSGFQAGQYGNSTLDKSISPTRANVTATWVCFGVQGGVRTVIAVTPDASMYFNRYTSQSWTGWRQVASYQ